MLFICVQNSVYIKLICEYREPKKHSEIEIFNIEKVVLIKNRRFEYDSMFYVVFTYFTGLTGLISYPVHF